MNKNDEIGNEELINQAAANDTKSLTKFMLENMLTSTAFAALDKDIQEEYQTMVLNQGPKFALKVDLNRIFKEGKLTKEARETL